MKTRSQRCQQAYGLTRLRLGIGLAALGREGREADPPPRLRSEGVGTRNRLRRPGILKFKSELPEDVAVTQHGMPQGLHAAAAAADKRPLFAATLADPGDANAPKPHRESEGLRAQRSVDIRHGIHAETPRIGGQAPDAPQRMVGPLHVGGQELDVEARKKKG